MTQIKHLTAKCLPLASELLIVFLTADILWQLLCGRPPFSMAGFLLSGVLMTAGNHLFLRKPRLFWQILLLNIVLCAVWIPLLSLTLDRTYPPLLVLQIPLYLFPLCRGYHWGVAAVSARELRGAGEYMGLYSLFYLIVASFVPQLLARTPVLLAVLALDLLGVVGMRTSGRNTIRAGSPLSRLPALLLPVLLIAAASAGCLGLLAARGSLIPLVQSAGSLLQNGLVSAVGFLMSLFWGRSSSVSDSAVSSSGGGDGGAALPDESAGPAIDPQVLTALLLFALAALVLLGLAALIRWIWRNRRRVRSLEGEAEEDLVRTSLRRTGLLARLRQRLRIRVFLARYAGTPRAALLQLERWGARHRCRRQYQETPREYLGRLAQGPLSELLSPAQRLLYDRLIGDVDRSLYGSLPPRLSREQVRELLSAIRRGRTPPAAPRSGDSGNT